MQIKRLPLAVSSCKLCSGPVAAGKYVNISCDMEVQCSCVHISLDAFRTAHVSHAAVSEICLRLLHHHIN
jgi:hypothetical protein